MTNVAPSNMKAFKCLGENKSGVVDTKVPDLRDDYILVQVSHVALNPTDWKHIAYIPAEGATVGCDYSGKVLAVGKNAGKNLLPGARVAGFTHGTNKVQPEDGCFGEYCVAKAAIQMALPENISDEDAATLGVGVMTIGQGMYQALGLPMPGSSEHEKNAQQGREPYILIYGASTAMGFFALQYARLSGFRPIAVCSPRNFNLVKKYGAESTFNYKDPEKCAQQIREHTQDGLMYAFDCIAEGDSPKICAGALSSKGGAKYSALLPVEFPRPQSEVQSGYTLGYTAVGEAFEFRGGQQVPAKPEDLEFAAMFANVAEALLKEGRLRAPPVESRSGGLEGISGGLEDLKNGKVSGKKVVYKV